MMSDFFRFPHTQHIAWLGDEAPRDDKVLAPSEVRTLLCGPVIVEEKLDGANLGFSISANGRLRAQNRGQYLPDTPDGQFRRLPEWMALHGQDLANVLDENLMVFGEWCAARHSLRYSHLPDWWLLFDVYDRQEKKFWSSGRRDSLATAIGVAKVPCLASGVQTVGSLVEGLQQWESRYRDGELEGVVVRRENKDWLEYRGKLVRADFAQAIDKHWRSRKLEWNWVTPG